MTQEHSVNAKEGIILATDLAGFSLFMSERGEIEAIRMLDAYYRACESAIEPAGEVVKFIGDSILARFPQDQADQAVDAAQKITEAAALIASCGLDAGEYAEANIGKNGALDVFGKPVNGAFLVMKEEGICATDNFVELLEGDKRARWKSNAEGVYLLV